MPDARRRALRDGTPMSTEEAMRLIRWARFRLSQPSRPGEEVELYLARVIAKYEIALQLTTLEVDV